MTKRNILFLLFISFSIISFAQENEKLKVLDYSLPKEYTIADVTVSGVEFLQKEVLISMSGLRKGNKMTIPGDEITGVIEKFWSQGLFSDVQITATKIENGKFNLTLATINKIASALGARVNFDLRPI